MSDQEIVVTSSDQTNVAARESKSDTSAAVEQPKPSPGKDAPKPDEARNAAADAEDHEDSQNETGESADRKSGDAPAQQARKKPGVHQRIDELTREKHDERRAREAAERDREYWREQAMRQQGQQPPGNSEAPAAATQEAGEPTLESCDYDQVEFTRKWYAWRRSEEQKAEAAQKRQAVLQEKIAEFAATHPDFDTVVRNPAVPLTEQVVGLLAETDEPAAIAYYLAQNLSEAAAIAQMPPIQMARAIGRLEAKLSAPPAADPAPRQPAPKTVTQAPPPVTTLSGSPSVRKSYSDMTQEEYEQARRDERAAKGLRP